MVGYDMWVRGGVVMYGMGTDGRNSGCVRIVFWCSSIKSDVAPSAEGGGEGEQDGRHWECGAKPS